MSSNTLADLSDEVLNASVRAKSTAAVTLLHEIDYEFDPAAFANSFGAEDMVLTDLIVREGLHIDIFSLDTGRLPAETYELMAETEHHYGRRLNVYYPKHHLIERYVRGNGINAFYESVALRKECCHVRKVEPLQRALAGKKAWITGLRAQQAATRDGLPLRQFDSVNQLEKFNPLSEWSEREVWAYIRANNVPYNRLHDKHTPSIGCAPCTRAVASGEDVRAGRWWWESPDSKECGLHIKKA